MTTHSRLSASQTKRWWTCPGSIPAGDLFPELLRPSGEAADLGTSAHRIVEECLIQNVMPHTFEGRIVSVLIEGGGTSILKKNAKLKPHTDTHRYFLVDDDMIEATTEMIEYVKERLVHYGETDNTKEAIAQGVLLVEQKVNPLPHRDDTGGTGDVLIKGFDEIEVIDYKNGSGVFVPVYGNHQLRTYGSGSYLSIPEDERECYENVRYTIVQPRHFKGGISWETMTAEDLKAWTKTLDLKASRVDEATELLNKLSEDGLDREDCLTALAEAGFLDVGEDGDHCGFCDLRTYCPATTKKIEEIAEMDFKEEPEELLVSTDAEQLARMLPWVPMLRTWAKNVEARADELTMGGEEITGFKLVRNTSSRTLKPTVTPKEVVGYLKKNHQIDEEDCFTEPAMLSGPQLEKLINSKNLPAEMKTVKAAKAEFSAKHLYKPEAGIKLVPDSDRREAISVDADADFTDEEI